MTHNAVKLISKLFVAVALVGGLCAALAAGDDSGLPLGGLTVRDFKYRGDGYLLIGREAVTTGNRIQIRGAQMHLQQEDDKIVVFSPLVLFDRKTQRGSSDEKVQVRSRRFTMEGVGFDADLEHRRIRIRSHVKIRLYESAVDLLDSAAPKE